MLPSPPVVENVQLEPSPSQGIMECKVLLVDDHRIIRSGLRALLEAKEGVQVLGEADDGRQALALAEKTQPDVVVLDLAMPNLNGIETAKLLRQQAPELRIIVLSMHGTPEYVFEALKAGVDGYLLKSDAASELLQALKTVLAGERYLSQKVSETAMNDYVRRATGESDRTAISLLSQRERQVLELIGAGRTTHEIAAILHISQHTVLTHRRHIMGKLDTHNLPELVRFAIRHGLALLE